MDASSPSRYHGERLAYWRSLLRRTLLLLSIWFVVGPVLGILLADRLNVFVVGGLPVGFWIAQQGAIYVFVVLIFVYAWLADRADVPRDGGAA